MDVFVVTEQRFVATPEGVYAEGPAGYTFWQRYLAAFETVRVVGRVIQAAEPPTHAVRADGDGVCFEPLSYYVGPTDALFKLPGYIAQARRAVASRAAAYILRAPGMAASVVYYWLRLYNWPYGVELVGDPAESLSYTALRTRWSTVVRQPLVQATMQLVANANVSTYVTARTLQARYPNTRGQFSTHVSDTALPDLVVRELEAALAAPAPAAPAPAAPAPAAPAPAAPAPAAAPATNGPLRLVFVGSLAQRYKGLHVLLEALAQCVAQGLDLTLTVLGDGSYRTEYEQQRDALGLTARVAFAGAVPHAQVFDQLRASDLFVMPSLVEGLPRAMIEAMACGLPVIGARVGGIPELLPDELLVPPGDAPALATGLAKLARDPALRAAVGRRNRQMAADYLPERLRARLGEFLAAVHRATEQHMRQLAVVA